MRAPLPLLVFLPVCLGVYVPGQPGASWTEEEAAIVKKTLLRAWDKNTKLYKDFDLSNPEATSTDYVYDPLLNTTRAPIWRMVAEGQELVEAAANIRSDFPSKYSFTARKALRMAFHDCIPYANGDGVAEGCDGCLNLNANLKGNFGLQHSAAVLEKIYMEKDYLTSRRDPRLAKSLYESGKSRADLWAFAAIVALDFFQSETQSRCTESYMESMCSDAGKDLCFAPFPEEARTMFHTGRVDCHGPQKDPGAQVGPKQGYATFREESHPNEHGNGKETTEYYNTHFDFRPREALAIMGAHTVGQLNSIISGNAYAWKRVSQNLFNNKYYKLLTGRPQGVYDECVGNYTNQPAEGQWAVLSNIHVDKWKRVSPADEPLHLRWQLEWIRCPSCVKGTRGYLNDETKKTWMKAGKGERAEGETGQEWCCRTKGAWGCNPDPKCTSTQQPNKVGVYINHHIMCNHYRSVIWAPTLASTLTGRSTLSASFPPAARSSTTCWPVALNTPSRSTQPTTGSGWLAARSRCWRMRLVRRSTLQSRSLQTVRNFGSQTSPRPSSRCKLTGPRGWRSGLRASGIQQLLMDRKFKA